MIINLSMNSQRTAHRGHQLFYLAFILVLLLVAPPVNAGGRQAPPAKPAGQYPAFDAHDTEKVSVAIDPCTEQRDCDFFRLPYIRHSLIPVRVIISNDSDAPLDLSNVRMQFISSEHDKLPAADYEEINRRLFSTKDAMGTKIPLIPIPIHHAPVDKKILEDDRDFGFNSTTVAPHSTLAGYLFYDLKDFDDPNRSPLRGAELYVKMIRIKGGKELFAFSIQFDKWLNATSSKPASTAQEPKSQSK